MGLSTTYTKAETDFLLQQIDKKVVEGYKGIATQSNAPTPYSTETYPNGLTETYRVFDVITSPNSWGNIAVTQAELNANYVFFTVINGVVSKKFSAKPLPNYNTDTLSPTSTDKAETGKTVSEYVQDKINPITIEGANLFDKSKVLNGTYRNSTGVYAEDRNLRAMPMIFLLAGQYTISGASTIFFGNIYNSHIPSTESRISVIKDAGGVYESTYTFTVPNSVNGGAWVGINIMSAGGDINSVNTAMLAKGTNATFEPYYGIGLDASKLRGDIAGYAKTSDLSIIQNAIGAISTQSYNLLDKSAIINGSYYRFSDGAITSNATWKRIMIKVLPNTEYTLSGISTTFVGWELNSSQTPITRIGSNDVLLTEKTFTTGATTEYVGLNIQSQGNDVTNTAMLNIGVKKPYIPFGTVVKRNAVQNLSDLYYEFNGTDLFIIYMRYSIYTNYYVGYKVQYFNNAGTREDLWRIAGAKEYYFDGTTMADTGVVIVTSAESEAVFLQAGKTDFTGGYHGDEKKTDVLFIADGVEVTAATPLTPITRFEYVQKSNMLETDNTTDTIIAEHKKHTIFENEAGYYTNNVFIWKAVINVKIGFVSGISCIATTQANFVFSEKYNKLTLNRDNVEKLNETGSNEMNFVGTNYGSKVVSEITNPIAYNSQAVLKVYDATQYNKYYRSINNKTTAVNEEWQGWSKITHFRKEK